jgi:hypothetical protein
MADKGVSCHESCHAGGMCTGALISSRTFVSAAHCHQYAPMTSGGTFFVPGVGRVGIERTFSQGGQPGDDDIAFGRAIPENCVRTIRTLTSANWSRH